MARSGISTAAHFHLSLSTATQHCTPRYLFSKMEHEIDGWIEQLSQCKQLPEADVKKLCDKVRA
jgi:hypothetical protein